MNIFHIGLCVYPQLEGLTKAFWKAADNYVQCRPESPNIRRLFDSAKPDLVFMQIQTEKVVDNDLIQYMARSSFVINWTGDMRQGTPTWMYEAGATITCFSNMRDVNTMRAKGFKSEFLQIGIDEEIFKYWDHEVGNDIVFMANNYGHFPLSGLRRNSAQILKQRYGTKFSLLGNGWQHPDGNLNANQIEESKFYSGSRLGINISHFDTDRYSSDRIFRIMASGCFCLSHHYKGIEKDFKVGIHLDTFRTPQEMCQKVDKWIENVEERGLMAQQGYRYVHENFRYKNMIDNVLDIYKKYK